MVRIESEDLKKYFRDSHEDTLNLDDTLRAIVDLEEKGYLNDFKRQ